VTGRKGAVSRAAAATPISRDGLEDSEQLLDELWRHATRLELTWYQQWRVGDLVMWDNRCALHRRDEFDPQSRRLMHRNPDQG